MTDTNDYAHPKFLISAEGLARQLAEDDRCLVFDCTVHLRPDPPRYRVESGASTFAEGHIAGAAFLDLTGELSDPSSGLGFTLPAPAVLQRALRAAGIDDDRHVVLYSRGHMMWATRLWWMLHGAGHEHVAVLDGGFRAWQAMGGAVATGSVSLTGGGSFTVRHDASRWADKAEVLAAIGSAAVCTINALSPEVYAGTGAVNYGRPGHIPSSLNVPYDEIMEQGHFRDGAALRAAFAGRGALDGRRIITYCGGGISATVDAFALRLIGVDGVAVYDGSMSEWAADPTLPLTSGTQP
jgi:thiosulfate/3-mercaptopyruvate sulfurtransferase